MKRLMHAAATAALTITAVGVSGSARADEGMWLLNAPPRAYLQKTYGWSPDDAWLRHLQRSAVRFNTGGSGSIVSPRGLVMTNHHVGRDMLAKLSTRERDLNVTGFYAKAPADELKCPDLEIDVLIEIRDATAQVTAAAKNGMSLAEANAARQKAIAAIVEAAGAETKLQPEMVTLYQGGRYHLYLYKRYTDVRVTFAPEEAIAFFGGDADNFEFPRFDLDMCFFRLYEAGKPAATPDFLRFSAGAQEGDLAIVVGHPGTTRRLYTMDHLRHQRDFAEPFRLSGLLNSEIRLQEFAARGKENRRIALDDLFGYANARKATSGQFMGLLDPAVMGNKAAAEQRLRQAVAAKADAPSDWATAWDDVAKAQQAARRLHVRQQVLRIPSELFRKAKAIVELTAERPKPSAERLREYRDSELESVEFELYSEAPIYPQFEQYKIMQALAWMAANLGADDPLVIDALAGKSPAARAEELVKGTTLADPAARRALVAGGAKAVEASTDAMIALARALDPHHRKVKKEWEDTVEAGERSGYARIAAAKFAIEGENTYPDATFTLRMAFGPIKGLRDGQRDIPAFTTIGGAYDHAVAHEGEEGFKLPPTWIEHKGKLDLSTPYNFVCTADIIGGNSGSPVVNKAGEVIGLIFDGNIQSLAWAYAFDDVQGRAIAVDSRAILGTMRHYYGAGALADEITRPSPEPSK